MLTDFTGCTAGQGGYLTLLLLYGSLHFVQGFFFSLQLLLLLLNLGLVGRVSLQHIPVVGADPRRVIRPVQGAGKIAGLQQNLDEGALRILIHVLNPRLHVRVLLFLCGLRRLQLSFRLLNLRFFVFDLLI